LSQCEKLRRRNEKGCLGGEERWGFLQIFLEESVYESLIHIGTGRVNNFLAGG
jgi:hypothetical protein